MREAGSCMSPLRFLLHFLTWRCSTNACSCLQKVTQAQPNSERAEICSVCTTPYSIRPPPVAEATFIRMLPWWRYGYGSEIPQYAPGVA
jgi:hypothetical protein